MKRRSNQPAKRDREMETLKGLTVVTMTSDALIARYEADKSVLETRLKIALQTRNAIRKQVGVNQQVEFRGVTMDPRRAMEILTDDVSRLTSNLRDVKNKLKELV